MPRGTPGPEHRRVGQGIPDARRASRCRGAATAESTMLPTPHRESHAVDEGSHRVQERDAAVGWRSERPGIGADRRGPMDHPQQGRDVVWSDIKEEKTIGEERDENAVKKVRARRPITCWTEHEPRCFAEIAQPGGRGPQDDSDWVPTMALSQAPCTTSAPTAVFRKVEDGEAEIESGRARRARRTATGIARRGRAAAQIEADAENIGARDDGEERERQGAD